MEFKSYPELAKMNMLDIENRLFYLKALEKKIEEEKNLITSIRLEEGIEEATEHKQGKITYTHRVVYKIKDNMKVIEAFPNLTKDTFIKEASLAAGKLKKIIGEIDFEKAKKKNLVFLAEESTYYSVKINKETNLDEIIESYEKQNHKTTKTTKTTKSKK